MADLSRHISRAREAGRAPAGEAGRGNLFDANGKMRPEAHGREILLRLTVGYPGSRVSDLLLDGVKLQIPNEHIRAALQPEDPS
jgi:hypothetical protein